MNIDVNALQQLPEVEPTVGLKKTCVDDPPVSVIKCKTPTCQKTVVSVVDVPTL